MLLKALKNDLMKKNLNFWCKNTKLNFAKSLFYFIFYGEGEKYEWFQEGKLNEKWC